MGFKVVSVDVVFSYVSGNFVRYKYIERKNLISN